MPDCNRKVLVPPNFLTIDNIIKRKRHEERERKRINKQHQGVHTHCLDKKPKANFYCEA